MPKFSVVITVYNKEDFVQATVESVLNQSVQDFEIIIVNDASTDDSANVIKNIDQAAINYIELPQNVGASAARNIGIKSAKGSFIALLDGDDIWDSYYLAEIVSLIHVFPQHHVFATAVFKEYIGKTTASNYSFDNPNEDTFLDLNYFESSYKNSLLTSSSAVIHKSVFNDIGFYDESIKSGQDTDLWIRIGIKYRVAFSTKPAVTYIYAPQSLYKSIRSITHRPDYLNYLNEEEKLESLKKFIDLNRYSLILRARLWNESQEATVYLDNLDLNNLNSRQRFLLNLPPSVLKIAFKSQKLLAQAGINLSAF